MEKKTEPKKDDNIEVLEAISEVNEKIKKLNDKFDNITEDGIEMLDELPKKNINISTSTIAIIFLSIAVVMLCSLIFIKRDAIFTATVVTEKKEIDKATNNKKDIAVPVEDTYALALGEDFGIQYFTINNGILYYKISEYSSLNNFQNYRTINFNNVASYDVPKDLTKYEGIEGIRRIKTYNYANNVEFSLLLIIEDGSVYRLTYMIYYNQFNLTKLNIFDGNKVDDILDLDVAYDCVSKSCASSYSIITLDGKKVEK